MSRSMQTIPIVVVSSAAFLGVLQGCSSTGRCVGAAGAMAAISDSKVLQNLDSNGVAIEGYDPVAFFTDQKPVKGDPKITSAYGGAIYWFASAEHKALFDAKPTKYQPQFGGYCAYAASIDTISPIDPNFWEIVDGRLILQHNKKAWDKWHADAPGNLVKANRNWPGLAERNGSPPRTLLNVDNTGLANQGYDPTSYFVDGRPIKGDPTLARIYQGATYLFVDNDHKNVFEKDPAKYVPQFGGFCGYAASINKVSPVDPQVWEIVDGRLVLHHTDEAHRLFDKDVDGNYARAKSNWPGLSHRRCG